MQAVCLIGGRCSAVVDVDVCRRACRNSSHILPPGANVQRSVQPAAIAAAHHGHGPRSLPHTCDAEWQWAMKASVSPGCAAVALCRS
jgi:hypothetical protein